MNQLQAFQFGFKNLAKVTAVDLRIFSSSSMGSKRNVLASSKAESIVVEDDSSKGKRLKALVGTNPNHEKPVLKESSVESVLVETFKDDPEKIKKMTVRELRTTLRSVGLPSKGLKSELISVLKIFVDKKINGQCSHLAEEQVLSISTKGVSVEKEDEKLYDKDQAEGNTKMGSTKPKLSVKSGEVTGAGGKLSQSETSISSKTIDAGVCGKVGISPLETEPWAILAHKNPQKHWIPYNPRTMRPPPLSSDTKCVKLMSWNVNGLRALLKLEGFSVLELAQREDFDVLCLQETKLQEKDVKNIASMIDGYHNSFWTCSVAKLGYSGTAIISRIKPLSVKYGLGISDHDSEGRLVTAEFDSFYLICGYVPNSGDGLKRLTYRTMQWDPSLSIYMKELEKSKPVILTGDLNCAHQEIDIFNPAGNKRSAGFTIEERQSFEKNFLSNGFVDTFRRQHPGTVGYTYWGYRHGGRKANKGWRLDYFLASESIADQVHDSYIAPDIHGSDHCPIGLVLKL